MKRKNRPDDPILVGASIKIDSDATKEIRALETGIELHRSTMKDNMK